MQLVRTQSAFQVSRVLTGVQAYYSMGKKAMHATNDLDLDDVQRKYERSWIFSN